MAYDFDAIPILRAFLVKEDSPITPFGSGHINDTYRIESSGKDYILQRINHEVFKDPVAVMNNIASTGKFLKQVPYPLVILAPLETKDGYPFFKDDNGNFWRLFPFIQESKSYDEVPDASYAFKAAKAFGTFIGGLKAFDANTLAETIPGFHNGAKRWRDFEAAVNADLVGRKKGVVDLLHRIFDLKQLCFLVNYHYEDMKLLIYACDGQSLPVRAIHHDTKINNVVFDIHSGDALCVIDLDTIMPGTVLSDFGDMVRTFIPTYDESEIDATKVAVRMDIFEAMTQGFLAATKDFLTPTEKLHLLDGGKSITFIQVIRFLGDYLNGDQYYKTHYDSQNLDRAKNQMALLESILEHEAEMLEVINRIS